jgi:hypothetical protein
VTWMGTGQHYSAVVWSLFGIVNNNSNSKTLGMATF